MIKKIFLAFTIFVLSCSSIAAEDFEEKIIPGLWYIKGTGYGEYSPIRLKLTLEGTMNVETKTLNEISNDVTTILSEDASTEIALDLENSEVLSSDMKALTSYDIYLRLNLTGLQVKAWDEEYPNGIKIPVLLPAMRPSTSKPFVLPTVRIDDDESTIDVTVSFVSPSAGKVRISGVADVSGFDCEIQGDCKIWRAGYSEPELEESTNSGCNTGLGIISALAALLVIGRSKKFCSGQI